MICQVCMKHSAVYHVPKIINNQIILIHLCKECVNQTHSKDLSNGFEDRLNYLLEGLIRSKDDAKRTATHLKCAVCGTGLRDLQKDRPLGCPKCYETFSEYLIKELRFSGFVFSKQKSSDRINENISKQINTLKKELKEAIESEDFEKAAYLRDKIRQQEKDNLLDEN